MRQIETKKITEIVSELIRTANSNISEDILHALRNAVFSEESELGRDILQQIVRNLEMAKEEKSPMCQDTGLTVIFVEIGQDVRFNGGDISEAIQEGVRIGSKEGFLRKSVVGEPIFERKNTGDNTPAIVHFTIVPGDRVKITVAPKGAGSENTGISKALKPSDGIIGIKDFVLAQVRERAAAACPPLIIGIGIGGNLEKSALLARKALLRPVNEINRDSEIARVEDEILKEVNNSGIGPMGLGGRITALKVNIETHPCHIASLPVALNLSCYANRHAEAVL
ncbi:MAG: fumarate hydratase [Candidatus Omnitrophica bacterium]|nr:fumarate hydratase [Candidatus Omnitrophota bacterium]